MDLPIPLFSLLCSIDKRISRLPLFRVIGDHMLLHFEREAAMLLSHAMRGESALSDRPVSGCAAPDANWIGDLSI